MNSNEMQQAIDDTVFSGLNMDGKFRAHLQSILRPVDMNDAFDLVVAVMDVKDALKQKGFVESERRPNVMHKHDGNGIWRSVCCVCTATCTTSNLDNSLTHGGGWVVERFEDEHTECV